MARCCSLSAPAAPQEVAAQFARERELARRIAAGEPSPALILWRPQPTLICGARERACLAQGAASVLPAGWSACMRDSGGEPVAASPAWLHVTWIDRTAAPLAIDAAYAAFLVPLRQGLAALGVAAYPARVPGSYCDGRYNLASGGRKLAGTALRAYTFGAKQVLLAHAIIAVHATALEDLAVLQAFLDRCARPAIDPSAAVSLEELLAAPADSPMERLAEHLAASFGAAGPVPRHTS